tara:strand:+ start:1030 stop:1143 length:114 start_codon:yes stop_codon:yes gene_type:complete
MDKRRGLSALVEKFCSRAILNMKVNIEGAYTDSELSI